MLEEYFPALRETHYSVTSPATPEYNCIAWAGGRADAWWEPDPMHQYYWPTGAPRNYTVEAYIAAFATLGYTPCETIEEEADYEHVALFVAPDGRPTHAARQMPDGTWTSKLGRLEDITHAGLSAVAGGMYGEPRVILRRKAERQ